MKKIAFTFPIIAGTCWGCCGVFVRVLQAAGFDNITITTSRIGVVVLLLGLLIFFYDKSLFRVSIRQFPLLALVGASGYLFLNYCYNVSITTLSMSLATILLCTAPVFVIIFGSILFGERITVVRVICMLAALAGCTLLSGVIESGGLSWSLFGILMGVGSAVCNAISIMAMNEASDVRKLHPLTVQFYASLFALIPMLFLADFSAIGSFVVSAPLTSIPFLIAHALIAALLPNLLFNISFKYVDSSVVSILAGGAEPTSALLFGLLVYHEVPTIFGLAGIIIVVIALIVLSRSDLSNTQEPANEKIDSESNGIDSLDHQDNTVMETPPAPFGLGGNTRGNVPSCLEGRPTDSMSGIARPTGYSCSSLT